MKLSMANARPFRSESGFAMIEVVVSAAVLAIVALAVLSGIDGATGSSAREKARAVAASLAEKDQERLRAMSVETLAAVPQSPPITVDGVNYTIKSDAGWITDDTGGTPACGNSSNNSQYFHITTTVTSAIVGTRVPAVKIDSLVSPSVEYAQDHGTIGVKIVDRNGAGLAGISVSGTGPQALASQTTDQNGCAIWREVKVGSYTLSVNTSGYCDGKGATAITRQQSVSPNTVAFVNITYDRCASATINVRTHVPGQTFSTTSTKVSKAREITDVSSNGTVKTWTPTSGTSASTFTPTNLFPYPSAPYGFFTGECQYQSPEKLGLTNYFTTTNPGASLKADAALPGQGATVFQPPVNIRVTKDSGGGQPLQGNVDIWMTLQKPTAFATDTCADDDFVMQIMTWPSTWTPVPTPAANTLGYATQDTTSFDPGMPFGKYNITCLQDKAPNPDKVYRPSTAIVYDNTAVDGGPALNLAPSTWTAGTCP